MLHSNIHGDSSIPRVSVPQCYHQCDQDVSYCPAYKTNQQEGNVSKQPIRARYLGHVTGYQPIRNQYQDVSYCPAYTTNQQEGNVSKVGFENIRLRFYFLEVDDV